MCDGLNLATIDKKFELESIDTNSVYSILIIRTDNSI